MRLLEVDVGMSLTVLIKASFEDPATLGSSGFLANILETGNHEDGNGG